MALHACIDAGRQKLEHCFASSEQKMVATALLVRAMDVFGSRLDSLHLIKYDNIHVLCGRHSGTS
jgi:hypothetical protein